MDETELKKVKKQARHNATLIAFATNSKYDLILKIEKALVEAYVTGYDKAENQYNTLHDYD